MSTHARAADNIADINLAPLVDVLFVILIIMMVNMPIQIEEMGVRLPSPDPPPPTEDTPPDQLVIAIYEDGTLGLNRRLMPEEVLFHEVTRRLRPMTEKNIFIDADPRTPYGRVVSMMDLSRMAGAARVGLARMKEQGPLPATSVAPGTLPRGVDIGLPSTVGYLSESDADEAVQPLRPVLEGCYEQGLARRADLSGRVMLRVSVAPDGSIMESRIGSANVEDEALEDCIREAGRRLSYPPLGEDHTAVVQYPLLFSPG